ncbi:MBL fold metallo-hydrolase [Dendrosporobacter sp. 1207_IL3150]|uniref:MBL fold metallo-hydrolase n=1 Tax=Dendrosporobacter sp. 1207_IL3150 TaxID=3084054 RepID=UPI002FD90BE2
MEQRLSGINETTSTAQQLTMGALGVMQNITDQSSTLELIAPDVAFMRILMVNICFIGKSGADWVLVDCGLPDSAEAIIYSAQQRFGTNCRPSAIILTHGHFDHVGAIVELIEKWSVPVYAHKFEIPFLTGEKDYFTPDPTVNDGLMSKISPLYPNQSINLGSYVKPLPDDYRIPGAPQWRWIATPGHTPGHISLFRDSDRTLIAGDAFTTTEQESALAVINQTKEIHGPPKYFTTEWQQAWQSVKVLNSLKPETAITGHGLPMVGSELRLRLNELAQNFDKIAIPEKGRYVP